MGELRVQWIFRSLRLVRMPAGKCQREITFPKKVIDLEIHVIVVIDSGTWTHPPRQKIRWAVGLVGKRLVVQPDSCLDKRQRP